MAGHLREHFNGLSLRSKCNLLDIQLVLKGFMGEDERVFVDERVAPFLDLPQRTLVMVDSRVQVMPQSLEDRDGQRRAVHVLEQLIAG